MDIFSNEDIECFRLTDFMAALGYNPVKKEDSKVVYNAPYNIGTLHRAYGIYTKGFPSCEVDTGTNTWRDNKWINYAYGDITSLVLDMFDYRLPAAAVEKFILDTMTEYNRIHPVYLQPIPRISLLRQGDVPSSAIRPGDIPKHKFLEKLGYTLIERNGNILIYKDYCESTFPKMEVDISKNTWKDKSSGFSGSIYEFTSKAYGGDTRSQILKNIAYIYTPSIVTEVHSPWGLKKEQSESAQRKEINRIIPQNQNKRKFKL